MPDACLAQLRLRQLADAKTGASLQKYFKTGPGEYGHGDTFLGIRAPVMNKVAKEFAELPWTEIDVLLQSPIHEDRMLALSVLVRQYGRGDAKQRRDIYRLYLRQRKFVNNWDLVDSSAPYIVGPQLVGQDLSPLYKLAKSPRIWDRRIAVLATLHFIRCDQFDCTLKLAQMLLEDKHDLMHKAVGWMLREVGKRDEKALRTFLDEHAGVMPRTMLRYAIEKFSEAQRRRYLAVRENSGDLKFEI